MTIRFSTKITTSRSGRIHHYTLPSFRAPLYVRIRDGRALDWAMRTNILIYPLWWDPRREEISPRSACPEAERLAINAEVIKLRNHLVSRYVTARAGGKLRKGWLADELQSYSHTADVHPDTGRIFDEFLRDNQLSEQRRKQYELIKRSIIRFESYIKETCGSRGGLWPQVLSNTNADSLSRLYEYLLNEHNYNGGRPRSKNTASNILKKIRTFSNWCVEHGYLDRSPFDKFKISPELYGTPVCLTKNEVTRLYRFDFSSESLLRQRDIFVFQCNIGCRVSDLIRLTKKDCSDGMISYIPSKTIRTNGKTVTVPLNSVAQAIVRKYGIGDGPLLPFISVQKYNDAIKRMLRLAGITRQVTVLDPLTRQEKRVAICDMASSHMARRTFINNIYCKVKDPALVASLTGHADGSRAFSRYRTIDDVVKKELVRLLEDVEDKR